MRFPRLVLVLILSAIAASAIASPALASTIVVPNDRTTTVGNSTDGTEIGILPPVRLQQLYGSGQFASIGSPILIDQFVFRVTPGTGPFDIEIANLDLYMSTSSRFPNLTGGLANFMSSNFADNLGPDNTRVYHGSVSWVSPGCAQNGQTPCAFDLVVSLQTPFYYDFTRGRLLMDLFVTGLNGVLPGATDADDYGDGYGSMASMVGLMGDAAGDIDHGGDITQFRYTAVPEPTTMTLLVSGLGAAAVARRRRA